MKINMSRNPQSAAFGVATQARSELTPPCTTSENPGSGGTPADPLGAMMSDIGVLGDASLHYGARLLVIRELLRALCSHLPTALRAGITNELRAGTERILAHADERPLPDAFYHALLDEMNRYLECL